MSMPTLNRPPVRNLALILGVFALALVIRLICLWQVRDLPTTLVPISDARSYYEWSGRIAAGAWWKGEVFYQAPLYPYFLALVRLLGGDHLLVIRLVQAMVGALSCVLLAVAGAEFAGPAVGLAGAVLLAINGPGIFFDGILQKTVLDTFLLSALLACLGWAQRDPRGTKWFAGGLLLGLLCLSRENALLLGLTVPIWILLSFRQTPVERRARWLAAFGLGFALVLTPVAARNHAVGGDWVVTTSQLGPNLYTGNNPRTTGTYVPLRPGREDPAFERADATELAEAARGGRLSPQEVSDYWVSRAWEFVRTHPVQWLQLTGRKLLLLLNATEIVDVQDYYIYARHAPLLRVLGWFTGFGVILPLAAAGIWLTRGQSRRIGILHVILLTLFVGALPFCVFARYRFPLVPLLLLFAAMAMVQARELLRRHSLRPWIAPTLIFLVSACVARIPLISRSDQEAAAWVNLGIAAAQLGRLDQAIAYQDLAIRSAPTLLQAHYQRGVALQLKGSTAEARTEFERVLALDPSNEAALADLGLLLQGQGDDVEACRSFEQLLRREPNRPAAHTNLAASLSRLGRNTDAIEHCEKAIALEPGNGSAWGVLGAVLLASKDTTRAIESLRKAIELNTQLPSAHFNLALALQATGARDAGRLAEAGLHLRQALSLHPAFPAGYDVLVQNLLLRGHTREVASVLDSARRAGQASADLYFRAGRDIRLRGDLPTALRVLGAGHLYYPDHGGILNALAWYMATTPNIPAEQAERALEFAHEAARIKGEPDAYILDTEAAALAANGQYARAAEMASRAIERAGRQGDVGLAHEIRKRERLYRSGRPYVER